MTLDDQLRHHDPAHDVPDDLGRSPRAMATLARVTATEQTVRPLRRKRVARYAVAAVVAVVGVVVAPILGADDAAFATWDADPQPATRQEAAHYAKECAEWTRVPLGDYQPQVVEVRGSWVMTYLASADGEAQCLRSTAPSPGFVDGENESMSGALPDTPPADGLATTGVLKTSGGLSSTQFMVAGKAGPEVTGVVFEAQGRQVRATVTNGRFTAWWPQREPDNLWGLIMDETGYNGSTNPRVTITLSDGTSHTERIRKYDVNY
ncbi:hypothetical protein COUCH_35490 [Couchioplanes caeruleus]|uniref:hypothetical protein n=1 Tax=Couchioplanes caeruleus TaxID=56438 RepID=UPI0020BF1C2E|nr:hypothetical protein [Couchioplanes caeruleus]UQU64210.1 hypothetical protein COUCH_35490 [Couchioplanes caeruleus]